MPLLEVLKGEEPPTPEMILYFSGAAAATVVLVLGCVSYRFYQRHLSHLRYEQLQARQKAEKDSLMAGAADRRAQLNAKAQQRLDEAAKRNADRGNDEVYKRAQAKREFAEKQREAHRLAALAALEKPKPSREQQEEAAEERARLQMALFAEAELQRQMANEAAQESVDRAERMGKMMAREAAKRLAEYREKMEERERQNELVGLRPDDVLEKYSIKPAVPNAAKTQIKSAAELSPNAQRVVMPRRTWLPSKGWKSDREGGEDGRKWGAAHKPRSPSSAADGAASPAGSPTALYDPEAAGGSPSRGSPPRGANNVYPYYDTLESGGGGSDGNGGDGKGLFGGWFGGAPAPAPASAPAPR